MIVCIRFYKISDFQIPTTWNDVIMTLSLCFSKFVYKTCQRELEAMKLCRLTVHLKFYKICKFESFVTKNDVIMMSLSKTMEQWENAYLDGTKQNIHRWKGFDESYLKM